MYVNLNRLLFSPRKEAKISVVGRLDGVGLASPSIADTQDGGLGEGEASKLGGVGGVGLVKSIYSSEGKLDMMEE